MNVGIELLSLLSTRFENRVGLLLTANDCLLTYLAYAHSPTRCESAERRTAADTHNDAARRGGRVAVVASEVRLRVRRPGVRLRRLG